MNKLALLIAAAALAAPAWSAEYLEPESAAYLPVAEKDADLKEAFGPDVTTRMIVEPSFQFHYAVMLKQKQGHSFIVTLKFAPDVENVLQRYDEIERMKKEPPTENAKVAAEYLAAIQKDLPPYPKDAKPDRCEFEIDGDLAEKIVEAFKVMLTDVRVAPDNLGLDGTFYHFALQEDGKTLEGRVWSPGLSTRPGRLVALGEMMREHCQSGRDRILAEAGKLIAQQVPAK